MTQKGRKKGISDKQDAAIREAAFGHLSKLTRLHGDVLPRKAVQERFCFGDEKISMAAQRGVFKPKELDLPLSLTATTGGAYQNSLFDGYATYKYIRDDPQHEDNKLMLEVMQQGKPLIYFHRTEAKRYLAEAKRYLAFWPVYIIGDNPEELRVTLAFGTEDRFPPAGEAGSKELVRDYRTSVVQQRIHQQRFRDRVLDAYKGKCALCGLARPELLDAAHLRPDAAKGRTCRQQWDGPVQAASCGLRQVSARH